MSTNELMGFVDRWIPRWRKLNESEKSACKGIVNDADIDDLLIVFTPLPRYWGASATTLGRWVLTDPNREDSEGWHELMAHEAVHVEQWRDRGFIGFGVWYLDSYIRSRLEGKGHWDAYEKVPAEIEARERASRQFSN